MGLKALQLLGLIDKSYLEEDSAPAGTTPGPASAALSRGVNVGWANTGGTGGNIPMGSLGQSPSIPFGMIKPDGAILYKDPSMIKKRKKKRVQKRQRIHSK